MYSINSTYLSEEFKGIVVHWIKEHRDTFEQLHKDQAGYGKELLFGRRFRNDEDVWQGFCQALTFPFSADGEARIHAVAKSYEHDYKTNLALLMNHVFDALRRAAETDYYYEYEKDWGGDSRDAPTKDDDHE